MPTRPQNRGGIHPQKRGKNQKLTKKMPGARPVLSRSPKGSKLGFDVLADVQNLHCVRTANGHAPSDLHQEDCIGCFL